jgi:hyperosmotically inducible protein
MRDRLATLTPWVLGAVLALPATGYAQAQTTPRDNRPAGQSVAGNPDRTEARSVEERLEDRVRFELETDDLVGKYDVDVDVKGSVVHLSGDVATQAQKAKVLELAKVEGVTRVEDDIEVDPQADNTLADRLRRGLSKTGETINDSWITTKVHWFFMGEDALEDSDIDVDTANHVVTLSGTVASEAGRRRAVELARRAEGVKDVRDQLKVAPGR